jgi:hypothetical protein
VTARIYEGDIGTPFLVDAQDPDADAINLTGMTVALEVWKPGALTVETWTGSVSGTTHISYISVSGNFDTVGDYRFQSKVVSGSNVWRGVTWTETVYQRGA